ncbi:MAG: ribosomal protein S18-alanine N-acetyltransferase [candidate division NC10 bacterium]|nr:ribosomal protein S18-alanine N-acetyltransferase [candidate division NC10 bacterium]
MEIVVKPMAKEHLDAVVRIEEETFGPDAWPRRAFEELLETSAKGRSFRGRVWTAVAPKTGRVVGYAALEVSTLGEAELSNLAVAPPFRRMGVGRLLLDSIKAICLELGLRLLWLRVRASNQTAILFYHTYGFQGRGRFTEYYDDPKEDALIMALELSANG